MKRDVGELREMQLMAVFQRSLKLSRSSGTNLFVGLVMLMAIASCTDQEIAGMSPEEAFQDPLVVSLVKAAGRGDLEEIERSVEAGANVNAIGQKGISPLLWAMYLHEKDSMRKLLKLGADPNHEMDTGHTAVWLAAGNQDSELLEILLRAGGDPNTQTRGRDALAVAVIQNNFDNLKLLVEHGANVNQTGELPAHTAAGTACGLARWEMVVYLLEHGYTHDLEGLGNCVERRVVPNDTEFVKGKERVKRMLEEGRRAEP